MTDLTPKQRRFVDEYLIDLNAGQAAVRAGYAKSGGRRQGSRLLANPRVGKAISDGQRALARRAHVSAGAVLEKLAELRDRAAAKGQYSVALKAEELRGRHIGMFTERKPGQIRRLEEMSEEEILESLGLAKKEIDRILSAPGDAPTGSTEEEPGEL